MAAATVAAPLVAVVMADAPVVAVPFYSYCSRGCAPMDVETVAAPPVTAAPKADTAASGLLLTGCCSCDRCSQGCCYCTRDCCSLTVAPEADASVVAAAVAAAPVAAAPVAAGPIGDPSRGYCSTAAGPILLLP
jgi:hypothetical protein